MNIKIPRELAKAIKKKYLVFFAGAGFFILLLSVSHNVMAQQPKSANNTYTQTEIDLKLQLQQKEVEGLQKDIEVLQQTIKQQKEQIKEQDKYIQSKDKKLDWALAIMNFWIMFVSVIAVVVGYKLNKSVEKTEEKVKEELKKIETARQDAETHAKSIKDMYAEGSERITKVEQDLRKFIRENLDEASKSLANIIKNERAEKVHPEEEQKVEEQIEKIKEIKTENEYTSEDWFLKAYKAQKENKLEDACSFYEKAIQINPEDASAFNNWGAALSDLAKMKQDETLFIQAIEKYEKAIQINPEYATVFDNWGNALFYLAKIKQDEALFIQGVEKCKKAYKINPKKSYNLSCGYALLEDKKNALHYLKESLKNKTIEIDHVLKDDDWKNYLSDVDFINLIKKYK